MRQNQNQNQNKNQNRSRGRGRKPGNQSNRSFDSNGPDVKIRGSASHIYEKYQTLARDANAAGDRVGSENYLQHAEHYFRLMATAQAAQQSREQQNQSRQKQNGAEESASGNENVAAKSASVAEDKATPAAPQPTRQSASETGSEKRYDKPARVKNPQASPREANPEASGDQAAEERQARKPRDPQPKGEAETPPEDTVSDDATTV